jgi:hypothetical protein
MFQYNVNVVACPIVLKCQVVHPIKKVFLDDRALQGASNNFCWQQ